MSLRLNGFAMSEWIQKRGKLETSYQTEPADARISSRIALVQADSQNPVSLSDLGRIIRFGRDAPQKLKTRVSADVPLLCIPRTTIARRRKVGS
jgi:hypothetical protein